MSSEVPNRGKKPPKPRERFNDVRFVNYELSADERAACKAWQTGPGDVDSAALRFCEQGYRFSVKWDDYSHSFACFAQAVLPTSGNAGLMLTGRGSSPFKAVKQAMFKHFMIFDEEWGGFAETRVTQELDD